MTCSLSDMANILGFLWMGGTATRTRPQTHTVTNTRTATHIHTHPQPHTQLTPPAVCCLSDVMSLYCITRVPTDISKHRISFAWEP